MKQKNRQISSASFAEVKGSPGEAPRLIGFLRSFWPFFLIFAAAGYLLRAAWPQPPLTALQTGFLLLMLAGAFVAALQASEKRFRRYLKGARGEESVGRVLGFLPSGYRVLHGLSLPASGRLKSPIEVDHIVVGPTGVFSVETKNWSGTISFNDDEILYNGNRPDRSPVEQAKTAGRALEETLEKRLKVQVDVQPLVCFAGGKIPGGCQGLQGAVVCETASLNQVIMDSVEAPLPDDVQRETARILEEMMEKHVSA